jgi:hypothetical protein
MKNPQEIASRQRDGRRSVHLFVIARASAPPFLFEGQAPESEEYFSKLN